MLTEPLCNNRVCLIVGSAPDVVDDIDEFKRAAGKSHGPEIDDTTLIIGANGGAKIAYDHIGRCDVLVTTSHLYQQRLPHERATVEQMRGLEFESVWVDLASGICDGIPDTGILHPVDTMDRKRVIIKATGLLGRISTGVWALCLAQVSKASKLLYAGVEPNDNGHYGLDDNHPRDHVDADRLILGRLYAS